MVIAILFDMRLLITCLLLATPLYAQSARDYYQELYKAGGLDRMADQYVCFADDSGNKNFFVYSESETLSQFLKENGGFTTLPKSEQRRLNKGFLIVHGYTQGVPFSEEEFYDKDGESWVNPGMLNGHKMRMRLTIVPATMRYKRVVEVSESAGAYREAASSFGRCEAIAPGVEQKG